MIIGQTGSPVLLLMQLLEAETPARPVSELVKMIEPLDGMRSNSIRAMSALVSLPTFKPAAFSAEGRKAYQTA
ncbi:hypothetical protein NGM99_21255 [Mesorhizobium sp. RP14(2022)]|uniref:Transposase n=1 Tax=Mesorhizobium liriopis TaxID=2953882 RepID=A0ABT1CDP8_9HYPH|nr:hypothetical protein [Mesorhizobium liriopis]MCO6052321.1 hypothetical protein [Mesorhizobium liriopis]